MALVKYRNNFNDYGPTTFNSLFDNFFSDGFVGTDSKSSFLPKVDIAESDKGFDLSLAVPGLKKTDFNIEVADGYLSVSGERKFESKEEGKNYHSVGTQYGAFSKSFKLPKNVNTEKIEASYDAGILNLFLPKDEQKELKSTIKVK